MNPIAFRKAQPTPGDVHVDRTLTQISISWLQDQANYVAGRVFPMVPVVKQSDLYFEFSRADLLRAVAEKRAPSTETAGGGYTQDTAQYACNVFGFHKDVDDQIRANYDSPLDPDRNATQFVTQACMTRRELDWASKYFVSGVWTGSTTGTDITPGTLWSAANSTPIKDIRAERKSILSKTGFRANRLVLGCDVWTILQDHPDFVDRVNAGQSPGGPALVNLATLATILEIEQVMVAEAVINTGPEGGTESTDFIVGKNDALLCYAAPSPGVEMPSAGYIFTWTGLLGAGTAGNRINRIRADLIKSDRIEAEMAYDPKVVAPELGVFFLNVVS